MRVLVTGGTGFIGQHLVRQLLQEGYPVRCLVRDAAQAEALFSQARDMEFVTGDVTRPETLVGVAAGVDHVFHLAAMGHVSAVSEEAFKQFVAVNVDGTASLMRECGRAGVGKFIHFSSTAAMGLIKKRLVDETDPPQPRTPYQKSKYESEITALSLGRDLGVPTLVLRPCMVYGIGGRGEFFKMCRLMKKGIFPKVGSGRNLTPLVHVRDLVQAAMRTIHRGEAGQVYIIASARSLAMDELREMVMKAWGTRACYPYVPVWLMYCAAYGFELLGKMTGKAPLATRQNIASTVWDREFSVSKAADDLGYAQSVDFTNGVNETVTWYKSPAPVEGQDRMGKS